jgi:uncharacterized protein (TIGR02453 family)
MKTSFAGFPAEGFAFFRGLKRNNRREWFQARKQIFEEKVKAPMVELVEALNREMTAFAPDYVNDPKKAIYRIYRDTRFSNDKTPYKTHIAAIFPRRGMDKHVGGGLYFSVSPFEIEVAGGAYMPGPDELKTIRAYLAEHYEELQRIVSAAALRKLGVELQGDQLARVPKGYPKEHPAADLLRYKQLYVFAPLDPAVATTPQLLGEIATRFRAMTPLVDFLNAPLVAAMRKTAAWHPRA